MAILCCSTLRHQKRRKKKKDSWWDWWAKGTSERNLVKIIPWNISPVTTRDLPLWANSKYLCQEWYTPRAPEHTSKSSILIIGVPQVPLRVRHFYSFGIRTELQPSPVITPFDVPSPVQNSHKARITGWKRITDIAERPFRIWSHCFATHGQCDGSGWWKAMEPWHNFWHLCSGGSWELRSIGLM